MAVERLHLPSGASVDVDARGPVSDASGVFAEDVAAFRGRLFAPGGALIPITDLPLSDFHTLRAILRRLGRIEEPPIGVVCDNCDHRFEVRACATLELGPYRDGELDDSELDRAFDFSAEHDAGALDGVRLVPRTLGQARALHEALAHESGFRINSSVVRAMGIAALGGETDARRIARALTAASEEDFDTVCHAFELAHYPLRLVTPHPCPECGVMAWLEAPASREFRVEPELHCEVASRATAGFMDVDEFESLVREQAERAYRELRVRNVDLVVVEGPAEHDDAGEPLLGCYRAADPDALPPEPHEIRVFYRTFSNVWADEGAYDVKSEVFETLRHELAHHLAYLAGSDIVDEHEHAEIDRDVARRVGRGETRRRAVRDVGRELTDFARRTWLVWLAALVATLLALVADR